MPGGAPGRAPPASVASWGAAADSANESSAGVTAFLGPTNTGKTYRAIEEMLTHESGMIGLPLRLLAREVYDRISSRIGESRVALVTGEEKRIPPRPSYWVCTVESMPVEREVDFLAVDEIQLATHRQRGHTFTERLLQARGRKVTHFLGAETMRPLVETLLPTASIRKHPRFSKLRYAGAVGLGALPPRTAVVAFSVADVYEIAERLRARHGGTAVVLGALSPRTRNAQVAMYEAGDVQYMVATDAIGMGLNLDVDRVVFASLHKFDGREIRALESDELGQIAGRAGRYTRDGTFGTLRPLSGLAPRVVAAVENHAFPPATRLIWRNHDLDFTSIENLIASLRVRPRHPALRLVEQADDFESLLKLSRLDAVRSRAVGPEAVQLLWEVCRIPDFRKLLLDSHVRLLAAVYDQLSGPTGKIDVDWMARRIERLRSTEGDIETLMNRIAFIRTWTYITSHACWVPDAEQWQGITREIEDAQSDALHRRLTERFVERAFGGWKRGSRRVPRPDGVSTRAPDAAHPFARLLELGLFDEDEPPSELDVDRLIEATHEGFSIDAEGRITFEGRRVGRLRRGADLLHPEVSVEPGTLSRGEQVRIGRRLVAWARDAVEWLLAPLRTLPADALSAAGRGLVYQLERGLGTVDPAHARQQLERLTEEDRVALETAGVELGDGAIYLPHSLRPEATALRTALLRAHFGEDATVIPRRGAVSLPVDAALDPALYARLGYLVRGPRAIRADRLESMARTFVHLSADGAFDLPTEVSGWIGCRRRQLPSVLSAMGYRRVGRNRYESRSASRSGRRRRYRRPRRRDKGQRIRADPDGEY